MLKTTKTIVLKPIPFKLGENVGYDHSAFECPVRDRVVLKERKEVFAVLHGQTSDELLHNLPKQHKNHRGVRDRSPSVCLCVPLPLLLLRVYLASCGV